MEDDADGEDAYRRLVRHATAHPDVVGLVLTGSRAAGAFVRPDSDWDVRLVVGDDAPPDVVAALAVGRGARVEVAVHPLRVFTALAEPRGESAWDRYSFTHARVVVDKLDGRIRQLVADKGVLPAAAAAAIAPAALDAYVNAWYRSLKNARAGLVLEARLDAVEGLPPLLTAVFAIHGRVRPFNRCLGWELRGFPLPDPELAPDRFLPRLEAVVADAALDAQAALFRDVEAVARRHGLGHVLDAWEPDLARLRSGRGS